MSDAATTAESNELTAETASSRTRNMVAAALIAGLMAASGWISIPAGAVPVTLQVFGVVLAALLLPPVWAGWALGTYVLLGAAGVPVFANGTGGVGVLFGPTGGYLFGFVAGAVVGSYTRVSLRRFGVAPYLADIFGAAAMILVVYAAGWVWLASVLHLSLPAAFVAGVAPFLLPDAAKAAAAVLVAAAVRRSGVRL